MKIGLMFANAGPFSKPELLGTLAQNAEKFGFESIWTVEHVVIPQGYKSPYPYSKDGKIPGGEDVAIPDPLLPLGYAGGNKGTAALLPENVQPYLATSPAHLATTVVSDDTWWGANGLAAEKRFTGWVITK